MPLESAVPQKIAPTEIQGVSITEAPLGLIDLQLFDAATWLNKKLHPLTAYPELVEPDEIADSQIISGSQINSQGSRLAQYQDVKSLLSLQQIEFDRESKSIVVASFFLLVSSILLVLALRLRDSLLRLTKESIIFPSALMPELNWRRRREWTDFSAMTVEESESGADLILLFASGGKAVLKLNKLSNNAREELFIALDENAAHAARSPELVAFRHKLFSSSCNPSANSFTKLWEAELNSHYSSTNFVTLSSKSTLQNDQIRISMHISSGGLSAVYLAEKNKQMVVVKESVLPAGSSEENLNKARELFRREARVLMALDHPRIAKVLDYFQENGRDYLLLEYIPGITLREYVRRHGTQSEEKVIAWTKAIAEILKYLHEQDPPVIHRDLTPDNLMITPSGEIVLIDFGAANQLIGTATGTIVGKQYYISPEQFRGKSIPASDIYSLGGTLNFLLTGKDPEALACSFPMESNSSISAAMNEFVADCTRTELSKRIPSIDHLIDRLSSLETYAPLPILEGSSSRHNSIDIIAGAADGEVISLKEEEKILK